MRVDRKLLLTMLDGIERGPEPEIIIMPEPPGYEIAIQRWHSQLLIDGGYVTAQQLRPYGRAVAVGLTLSGQQLLDQLRGIESGIGRVARQIAERVFTGAAVGVLIAKAKALGLDMPG